MGQGVVRSYRDLVVWQAGMDLAETCYQSTRQFPREEMYGLISQIRRAAVSIPANIAEGYGRKGRKEYLYFLHIAQGSLKELETHIILSKRIGFLAAENYQSLLHQCENVGKLLRALIKALSQP